MAFRSQGSGSGLKLDDFDEFVRRIANESLRGDGKIGSRVTLHDLKIRTKDRRIVTFEPNAIQILYLDEVCPRWREGYYDLAGVRDILLKARQFGFSTLILAILFCQTVNDPNTQTIVIAHDTESTERLFQIVKRFYNYLPAHKKPRAQYANRREYLWPDLDSCFYVGTAGSGNFGRGGTINNVHASEVAFWPHGNDIIVGLLESVPADGNVIFESTANGLGNLFHREYAAAKNGDSIFRPKFFPWFQHLEYRAEAIDFVRSAEEEKLVAKFGLDDEQLAWRRIKAITLRENLPQEYPATDLEAFLTSGYPYFDREKLFEQKANTSAQIECAAPDTSRLLKREWEHIKVWKAPEPNRTYVIGADTAEGLTDGGDSDFDSADVADAETWEQVAHIHGRWDTHEYGLILAELGFWYNTALLGIERNNHGHAVINAARHEGNYPDQVPGACKGMYLHEEYDEQKNVRARKPGWPTTSKTKYFALDGLATSIMEGDNKINCAETLSEMGTFVKKPGGKAGGEGSSHDDRVMSFAITDALLRSGLYKKAAKARSLEIW